MFSYDKNIPCKRVKVKKKTADHKNAETAQARGLPESDGTGQAVDPT